MDLKALCSDLSVGIEETAEALDTASSENRVEAALSLDRAEQRALYAKAASSLPLQLADFVPPDCAPLEPVAHRGRNTLILPRRLQLFEKRFCLPDDHSARLFGYNQSPFIGMIGPGFFVAVGTDDEPLWHDRGAVVIDYFRIPDASVAESWPPVIPNTTGLQRFVYHGTRDFMRRVSKHVTIGAAFKGETPIDHYFVLVRETKAGVP